MKSFELLNNNEKAKLLYTLFPQKFEQQLKDLHEYCRHIVDNQQELIDNWQVNHIITPGFWIQLCTDILKDIEKFTLLSKPLRLNIALLQVCSGFAALVFNHVIVSYVPSDGSVYSLTVKAFYSGVYEKD